MSTTKQPINSVVDGACDVHRSPTVLHAFHWATTATTTTTTPNAATPATTTTTTPNAAIGAESDPAAEPR